MRVPFGLICNYKNDLSEISSIKKYLKLYNCENLLKFSTYHQDLTKIKKQLIKASKKNKNECHSFEEFGTFWNSL